MTYKLYTSVLIKDWGKVYEQIRMETLTLIHIGRAREVFHDKVIFFTIVYAFFIIGDALRIWVLTILM